MKQGWFWTWTYSSVYDLEEQSRAVTWRNERGQDKEIMHMRWKKWDGRWVRQQYLVKRMGLNECLERIQRFTCMGGRLLGRCVSSLKNLFFMLLNWWLEWWEGGCGGGGSFSLPSSSAALRIRGPSTLTNRIAALVKRRGREKNNSFTTWSCFSFHLAVISKTPLSPTFIYC